MEAREKHQTMINCWGSDIFTTQKALYIDVSQSCRLILKLFQLFLTYNSGVKNIIFYNLSSLMILVI